MPELVVEAPFAAKLQALTDHTIVKDETGRVLGRFVPTVDPAEYLEPDAQDGGLTEEEWELRLAGGGKTYTTAEVLAYLRSLK